ncbi:MAG: hypothetical protein K2Q01_07755, partial [Rickettsiales bacterium]|nr:hypothetical protein [Rickettsiales bacterium]
MMRGVWLAIAAILLPAQVMAAEPTPLSLIRATPSGEDVPASRQLVFQFNRAVVPLGRMERKASEIPVVITPALECEWRWINPSSLACNLPEASPMALATHYRVEMKPGIEAQDGAVLAEAFTHDFITERPHVRYSEFRQWKGPALPVVRLVFDQPVEKGSVAAHVFAEADGARVGLSVFPDTQSGEMPYVLPVPGEKLAVITDGEKRQIDEQLKLKDGAEYRRIWLVEPQKPLAADSHVVLKTEGGLVSPLGAEKSVELREVVAFDTYPE